MAGLFSDIGGMVGTLTQGSFYKDIGKNALKSIGYSNTEYGNDTMDPGNLVSEYCDKGDIRGIKQVFRTDLNGVQTISEFIYGKDFRCYDSDGYFIKDTGLNYRNAIQSVTLYEFQPYQTSELGTLLKKLNISLNDPASRAAFAESAAEQIGTMIAGSKYYRNLAIDKIAVDPEEYYKSTQFETDGFSQVNSILHAFRHGKWLNIYTLPIFDTNIINRLFYFNKEYPNVWEADMGNSTDKLLNTIASPIASQENTLIKTPKWKAEPGLKDDNFHLTFYLINDIDHDTGQNSWTFRNYRFYQNFFAGLMPVAMETSIMQSPNIYRVVIPGKDNYIWAKITGTVENVGKQRRLKNLSDYLNKTQEILSINENYLWPEAWKITLTITNLMPMSFSTYAAHLINGNDFNSQQFRTSTYNHMAALDGGALYLDGFITTMENGIKTK